MKRLLVIFIFCSPLVLFPAISFALDSTTVTAQETQVYKKYGPIRYYESLWSVSKKLRPNRLVSIQQTLVAIYKLNPDAFFAGDINNFIENSVINVPTDTFIKKQTNQDAINLINKYSETSKTENRAAAVANKSDELIIKSPAISEQEDVAVKDMDSPNEAVVDTAEQSLTAALVDQKYLPDPELQADNLSGNPEPATESENFQQNNSVTNNVENTPSTEEGSQSLIKIQALQTELNSVNEQLVATTKTNQEFKSKLQLLIDDIDFLKHKIDAESAAQLTLLELLEQYKPDPKSAQQPVIDNAAVNAQRGSWINVSSRNLWLVAGAALLLIVLILSLTFRRRTKFLVDEQPKLISGPDAFFVSSPSELQKDEPSNPAPQQASEIKPESRPVTMKDEDNSNSQIPRDSLNNVFITQDDRMARSNVNQSISLASVLIDSEKPIEVRKLDKQNQVDELTPANVFEADQPIAPVFLNHPEQLQDGPGQPEQNQKNSHVNVEKEQFTGALNVKNTENYIEIETLLKNVAGEHPDDLYSEFDFDLGLDEFPDMLGENTAIDIDDDQYGTNARLDLARAYLEIDDKIRAKKILLASIENSNAEQRQEIDKLLSRL